jgi:hypothetical protein
MSYQQYGFRVALPTEPEAVVFVQGMVSRNFTGWRWMWRNATPQRLIVQAAPGCVQVKASILGPNELMMVSWWRDTASLTVFFKSPAHREMMRWLAQNPEALVLWNETYRPGESGMYLHEPHGFALLYPCAPGHRSKHEAVPVAEVVGR